MRFLPLVALAILVACSAAPQAPAEPSPPAAPPASSPLAGDGAPTEDTPEQVGRGRYREDFFVENGAEVLAREVLGNGRPSLIFFFASWCPRCAAKEAMLQRLYGDGKFPVSTYKVDYDRSAELKARFGVTVQDTVVLVGGQGDAEQMVVGATETDLRMLLSSDA